MFAMGRDDDDSNGRGRPLTGDADTPLTPLTMAPRRDDRDDAGDASEASDAEPAGTPPAIICGRTNGDAEADRDASAAADRGGDGTIGLRLCGPAMATAAATVAAIVSVRCEACDGAAWA